MKTQMVDKSNFDETQYRADLDSAYQCGRASVLSVLEDIKAEIKDSTKCPYGRCIGGNKCANMNDCMIMGDHVISIIDKHISGKE